MFDKSILAYETATLKQINQDYIKSVHNPSSGINAIIVADGLGSYENSEYASENVCAFIENELKNKKFDPAKLNFTELFQKAKEHLISSVKKQFGGAEFNKKSAFGTTVICIVEKKEEICIGYLGNGAVFHIKGNFNQFPDTQYLPWNSLNYLNPHSISENGKNPLYKLISISDNNREYIIPTVVTIKKDNELFGDIIMACTDGIYSYDQTPIGKDDSGSIWICGEESMSLFYQHLYLFFKENKLNENELKNHLTVYLEELKNKDLMTDDCTLGLIISPKALEYQSIKFKREKMNENNK